MNTNVISADIVSNPAYQNEYSFAGKHPKIHKWIYVIPRQSDLNLLAKWSEREAYFVDEILLY